MLSSRVLYRSDILQTLGISSLDSRQQLRVRLALRHGLVGLMLPRSCDPLSYVTPDLCRGTYLSVCHTFESEWKNQIRPYSGVTCTRVVHCFTLSLCYLGAEMIITETQIAIQTSSSWATN